MDRNSTSLPPILTRAQDIVTPLWLYRVPGVLNLAGWQAPSAIFSRNPVTAEQHGPNDWRRLWPTIKCQWEQWGFGSSDEMPSLPLVTVLPDAIEDRRPPLAFAVALRLYDVTLFAAECPLDWIDSEAFADGERPGWSFSVRRVIATAEEYAWFVAMWETRP